MTGKLGALVSTVQRQVYQVMNVILSSLLTIVIGPIIVLLYIVNELVRRLVIAPLLRIFHGNRITLVSEGADNVWSFRKFGNSRNILVLTVYKNQINTEEYKKNFMSRVINYTEKNGYRPFLKLQTIYMKKFGYCCWKRAEDFDIGNHITVLNPPMVPGRCEKYVENSKYVGPNTPVLTESDVLKYLGTLTGDIEDNKPQWEEVIIPNYVYNREVEEEIDVEGKRKILRLKFDHKVRTARIFRCHHAYMDGASFLLITSNCMTDGQFPYSADPLAPLKIDKWEIFKLYFRSIFFGVRTLMKTIFVAARANDRFVTRHFQGSSNHLWSKPIQLSVLRDIKAETDSSLPAILATATAGAVRKLDEQYPALMQEKFIGCSNFACDTDRGLDSSEISEKYSEPRDRVLMGMIGAVGPYPDVAPRNRYTVVNFHANTAACTRTQRLETMRNKINRMGKDADFLVNLWMFQLFGKFPACFIQRMLKNAGSPIVISNTPWAKSRVTLMGDEVEDIGGWIPLLAFSGVGFLIMRYCETLRFCGVAEEACLPEEQLKFLINEIENEIHLLSKEVAAAKKIMNHLTVKMDV